MPRRIGAVKRKESDRGVGEYLNAVGKSPSGSVTACYDSCKRLLAFGLWKLRLWAIKRDWQVRIRQIRSSEMDWSRHASGLA